MKNSLEYSILIAQHLHHQGQESWSTKILKREKRMLLMYHMDSTLEDDFYTTDDSDVTRQAPKPIELQTQLTSSFTILTCPKPPQQTQQKLHHHNLSML